MARTQHGAASAASVGMNDQATMPARVGARAKALRLDDGKAVIAVGHRRGVERAGLSQEQLAIAFETQQPNVSRWGLPHEPHAPSAAKLAKEEAPREYVREVISAIADVHRLQVSEAAAVVHGDNHAARQARMTVELTDVMRVWAVALANNHLSDAELVEIQRELREGIDALSESLAYVTTELASRARERRG